METTTTPKLHQSFHLFLYLFQNYHHYQNLFIKNHRSIISSRAGPSFWIGAAFSSVGKT